MFKNKALEWIRQKRTQGYVPKFKVGDTIFAKNGEFTLLARIEQVHKIEGATSSAGFVGEYTMKYLVNNMSQHLSWAKRKDIRSIDAKYQVCENPDVFKVLYSNTPGEQDERTKV